jgi:hypothetical protein
MAVYSDNYGKPMNVLCGQNADFFNVKTHKEYCLLGYNAM